MLHGVFHGDLHGGNLFVQPDGRTALFDFGITGRLTEEKRHAFLRLLMTGMMSDMRGQLAAIRDLGALPPDTDLDAVIADLGLDNAAARSDTAEPRGPHRRTSALRETAARLRRESSEGIDAVRQEHGLRRCCDRHAGSRSRSVRRSHPYRHSLRDEPCTATGRPMSASHREASTSTSRASRTAWVSIGRRSRSPTTICRRVAS